MFTTFNTMEKIIFDVDTGHDDAIAIAMAAGLKDEIEVLGLIATNGNVPLDKTLENTLNVAEAVGLKCPVFYGSSAPLLREKVAAGEFHGKSGLDGVSFEKRKYQECKGNGILWAINSVLNNPGEITFVSVGPYTDLAICIKAHPDFAKCLKRIVVMGGSMGRGNATPSAEFNIWGDPEAAEIVFNSGVEVVAMPLDVTLKVILDEDILEKIKREKDSKYKKLLLSQLDFYINANLVNNNSMPHMHDPCTIAYLADPSIFCFEQRNVHVETKSNLTYGRTVTGDIDKNAKVFLGVDVDLNRFWDIFFKAFRALQ